MYIQGYASINDFRFVSGMLLAVVLFVTDCCQFLVNPLETEDEKTEKQKNLIKQRWLYVFGKPNTYNHL